MDGDDEGVEPLALGPEATVVLGDVEGRGVRRRGREVVVDLIDLLCELGEVPGEPGRVLRDREDEVVDLVGRIEDHGVGGLLEPLGGEEVEGGGLVASGVLHGLSIPFPC